MAVIHGDTFSGNKVSDYGLEHGYVDYRCLAKAFNAVLNNGIMEVTSSKECYWEIDNGSDIDEDGNVIDIYQSFIISSNGADILKRYTDEIVYYCEELDMFVWCVTHFGTGWDYVLTDIKIEK